MLNDRDRKNLLETRNATVSALRLFEPLPSHPVVSMLRIAELPGTTKPTATTGKNGFEAQLQQAELRVLLHRLFPGAEPIDLEQAFFNILEKRRGLLLP